MPDRRKQPIEVIFTIGLGQGTANFQPVKSSAFQESASSNVNILELQGNTSVNLIDFPGEVSLYLNLGFSFQKKFFSSFDFQGRTRTNSDITTNSVRTILGFGMSF
jgi:hypothetical protein